MNIIKKLKNVYPDKIITNITGYPELYYGLSIEARARNVSVKKYLQDAGFTYGPDATLIRLEEYTQKVLLDIRNKSISSSDLNEKGLYSNVFRISQNKGISVEDYIKSLGLEYKRMNSNARVDYETSNRLYTEFKLTYDQIGKIVGVSKQRVEQVLRRRENNLCSWINTDFSEVYNVFEYMIRKHIFQTEVSNTHYYIKNNNKGDVCFYWFDDINPNCAFSNDIPVELLSLLHDEKMEKYNTSDFAILRSAEVVDVMKKTCIKPFNKQLYTHARNKHEMSSEEYAIFLGFEGYVSDRDTTDRKIISFLEENLIDGEVYISSDPKNQWIRSFAMRHGMGLEEFVEFYGYKKAKRGKFYLLESYIKTEKEDLKRELEIISTPSGKVRIEGKLYLRIYIFCKKLCINIDELVHELGYERIMYRKGIEQSFKSDTAINNQISELQKQIEVARTYETDIVLSEDIATHQARRNAILVSRLKEIYGFKCQLCCEEEWMPIQKNDGTFYSEVHHIIPLSEEEDEDNTLDKIDNMIVVCPNHHKMLHYHNGGYWTIKALEDKLYFVNDEDSVEILRNYHLHV